MELNLPLRPRPRPSRMSIDALLNPRGGEETTPREYTHALQYYQRPVGVYYPTQTAAVSEQPSLTCQPRSADSSPGPYRRERYDSVSSSGTTIPERRRPPRPKYEEEEMYFIWYHRVDLSQDWKEVRESFNRQFPNRQRRGFQGIQCKFYRFIKEKKCPTLREQRRMRDGEFIARNGSALSDCSPRYGVREWVRGVWYPWMEESKLQIHDRRASS